MNLSCIFIFLKIGPLFFWFEKWFSYDYEGDYDYKPDTKLENRKNSN